VFEYTMRNGSTYETMPLATGTGATAHPEKPVPMSERLRPIALGLIVVAVTIFVVMLTTATMTQTGFLLRSEADNASCSMPAYADRTLKLAHEETFAGLFKDPKGEYKFEASDVIVVDNDYYAICDSSWAISRIGSSLTPFSDRNKQLGSPNNWKRDDSQYEAIVYDNRGKKFYAVRESVKMFDDAAEDAEYHAVVDEVHVNVDKDDYSVDNTCITEFEFQGKSKGFEGAVGLRDKDGAFYLLGLCEGNFCQKGGTDGNGRAVLMRKVNDEAHGRFPEYKCIWKTVRILTIPAEANFKDYSAISVSNAGRVAITSQENSQVWIGWLSHWKPTDQGGVFDPERTEIISDFNGDTEADGANLTMGVLDFPRDNDCNVQYCNIEGVNWLHDNLLVAVSDKAKDDQDFRCVGKDQSIHVFSIPRPSTK
jgi:hypothetical protein